MKFNLIGRKDLSETLSILKLLEIKQKTTIIKSTKILEKQLEKALTSPNMKETFGTTKTIDSNKSSVIILTGMDPN